MVSDWSGVMLLTLYGPSERYSDGSLGSVFVSKPVLKKSAIFFSCAFAGFGAFGSPFGRPLSRSMNAWLSFRPAFWARTWAGIAALMSRAISQSANGLEY